MVAALVPRGVACGGNGQSGSPAAVVSRPQQAISAERGRPIADELLLPWMDYYHVPGVSIAVASGDRIEWAKGYGVADEGTQRPVTAATTFQAASISKPIAAATALSLFHERRLDVDGDVRGQLETWRVPENAFTQQSPVTLRLLLSHSAGFNVHGFAGYGSGAGLPSLLQILDGTPPANNEAIRVTQVPGSAYRYSGGGYEVVQQLLEDIAGADSYPALAQAWVFDPAGMDRSSLFAPLDPDAASAHDLNGRVLPGGWHRYPELTAAGVWTTPSDLLRFAVGLQRAHRGDPGLVAGNVARQMLTAQRPTDVAGQSIGLGVFLEASDRDPYFQHGGANAGYRCYVLGYLERPLAIAVMTNSEAGDRILGPVIDALRTAYAP